MAISIPILLTSTILPHSTAGIYKIVQTEKQRYRQYTEALEYLVRTKLFENIIYADNSNSEFISDLHLLAKSFESKRLKIEVLNIPIENEAEVKGKGYGEGFLISQALGASELLQSNDSFFKLTGRYKLRNLKRILQIIEEGFINGPPIDFICQGLQKFNGKVPIVSTAFFWSRVDIWRNFMMDAYNEVDDMGGWAFEAVLAEKIQSIISQGYIVSKMPLPFIIDSKNTKNNVNFISSTELRISLARSFFGHMFKPKKHLQQLTESDFE
ncbi:MAG: hypothetical protein MUE70_06695 [Desulfobacterales bacterium]|jgi:hypothetical protein|nr:hypothetical protein [Acidobacteriota bacterium]MCU0598929.1 hypothetical protein [Desulfobacterales bacterium]